MHMISKQPETDLILCFTQRAAPADGMPIAATFLLRAPSEGTIVPAVPSFTSGSALAVSDAACKHHALAQDAARALMQQVRRLPFSMLFVSSL